MSIVYLNYWYENILVEEYSIKMGYNISVISTA